MGFINEYVSEEEIKKYQLEEIRFSYNPAYRKTGLSSSYRYMWTIDRGKNIYLLRVRTGKEEFSNRITWVLNWQGVNITIETDLAQGGSLTYKEVPYVIIWDLVSVKPSHIAHATEKNIVQAIKESLTAYGDGGANSYVDDVIVKFNF